MPIHCCAMQGRIDAIQALLFFDTEGSIKRNLEMENEVFNLSLPERSLESTFFVIQKALHVLHLHAGFPNFPHFARDIWKRRLNSKARPTVHTNPSRKRNFWKTPFKPEEFKNVGFFNLVWTRNISVKWSFSKAMTLW